MKGAHWTMIGLCFDMIGAFFLSVEAIKLENVRKLREKWLLPFHRITLSPPIEIVESQAPGPRLADRVFVAVYFALHLLAGVTLLFVIDVVVQGLVYGIAIRGWHWLSALSLWLSVPILIITLWFALFGLWLLGEIVHLSLTRGSLLVIRIVEFIEYKTATGVVGLIGLALLFIGFALQFYGTYASLSIPSP